MGAAIVSLIGAGGGEDTIVGATAEPGCSSCGRDLGEVHGRAPMGVLVQQDIASAALGADAIIDFSNAGAVAPLAKAAARARVALVSGTTALGATQNAALEEAAKLIPVLWAPNFSIGIHVLAAAVRLAARSLGESFDVEVVEVHHRVKADAPSGTAMRLVRAVQEARGSLAPVYGRQGMIGQRRDDEVGVLALRGGDVVGDHTVYFLGPGERIELTHRATSRETLARGALVAARWVVGRAPGRYSLDDAIGS
jgi:4-hydroxy-tetrahydrodipicolinate reductase